MAKVKVKGEGEERKAKKPKMTAEQKAALEAMKSFNADVERAKYINELSTCVLREMCLTCKNDGCNEFQRKSKCILCSIAAVAVGMIQEGGAK